MQSLRYIRPQHVAPNNVAIIWPELVNAGPTMLGYVVLICFDRLAGPLKLFLCDERPKEFVRPPVTFRVR